jgi:hypothetical protein
MNRRNNQSGRHRLGRPGLAHRRDLVAPGRRQRAQHRVIRRRVTAERLSVLVATIALVAIAVSGWYAASGATAVVQMLAR